VGLTAASELKLLAGTANLPLANEIAAQLGAKLTTVEVKKFSDGEYNVLIGESVRGKDVFVIQPTSAPVNDNFMELALLIDAARRASAHRVIAVIPYYGYARQDRLIGRSPISAALVASIIENAGADAVVCVDLHSSGIEGFFRVPIDDLSAIWMFAEHFKKKLGKELKNAVIVSPDVGGVKRARNLARLLDVPLTVLDKRRPEPNASEIIHVIGEVSGKTCIIADDMVDTASTLLPAVKSLHAKGAKQVFACASHAVFSGKAFENIAASGVKELIVTNSILLRPGAPKNVTQVSLAPLLSEAIIRIHENRSVSELFFKRNSQGQKTL
jgi:ribose-phosphate pyrophosphokinase